MRPAGAISTALALCACGVGVLGGYGGYYAIIVPWIQQGHAVPLALWAVTLGLIPLGVLMGGVLVPGPHFSWVIGTFTAALRMAVTYVLAHQRAPGLLKADVRDASVPELLWMLIVEALIWTAVAFLSFKVGAVFQRRWAKRSAHTG